jgi:hypothetical protein
MKKVATELVLIGVCALGIFLFFRVPTMLATFVIAGAAYFITKSCTVTLGILVAAVTLHAFNVLMKAGSAVPMYSADGKLSAEGFQEQEQQEEGFQPRDPISIHQRITANKTAEPLKHTSAGITGVLESPNILSSLELRSSSAEERGAAATAMPAGLKENFRIRTVEEASMPPSDSETKPVMAPYLQNGPDKEAELDALIKKGTETQMMAGSDMKGMPGM